MRETSLRRQPAATTTNAMDVMTGALAVGVINSSTRTTMNEENAAQQEIQSGMLATESVTDRWQARVWTLEPIHGRTSTR